MSSPTYLLTISTPEPKSDIEEIDYFQIDKRILADLPAMLEEIEENLTDLLPEGYKAEIREA